MFEFDSDRILLHSEYRRSLNWQTTVESCKVADRSMPTLTSDRSMPTWSIVSGSVFGFVSNSWFHTGIATDSSKYEIQAVQFDFPGWNKGEINANWFQFSQCIIHRSTDDWNAIESSKDGHWTIWALNDRQPYCIVIAYWIVMNFYMIVEATFVLKRFPTHWH